MVRTGVIKFFGLFLVIGGLGAGCTPKDIKVSTRGGFTGSGGGATDASFSDRSSEYSRAMLIELADVARDIETAIQASEATTATGTTSPVTSPGAPEADVAAEADVETPVRPLVTPACEVTTAQSSPKGTLKFETDIQNCKEKGATFEGTRYGKKVTFATLSDERRSKPFPSFIRVEAKGLDAFLKPNVNPKDALRVKSYRFLEAEYLATEEMTLVYRVSFESMSHYSLDLKAFTDNGTIRSTVTGLMTYDQTTGRISGYTSTDANDRMGVKVESARMGRSGGRIVRQEFFGSATSTNLLLNLSNCELPLGVLKTRFTVKPLSGDKKYLIDANGSFESLKDELVTFDKGSDTDATKATGPRLQAKLCSESQSITMTEFFAGLLY